MEKKRAARNKTISLSLEQEKKYLEQCISIDFFDDPTNSSIVDKVLDTTILGDCFDIIPKLPDKFVDLLIVDPPYNLSKTYGANKFKQTNLSDYEKFTRRWIEATLHTLKDNASIYICCDWKTSIIIGNMLNDYFIIQNRITWQREKGRGAKANWKNSMEDIWFASLSKEYTFNVDSVKQRRKVLAPYKADGKPKDWIETKTGNYRDTFPSNFWDDISVPYWSMPENTDHPTQKPEKLLAKLILASSNENDIILDPFSGTGTTSVVAKKLNRHYVSIEKEAEYCALSEKRLELADFDKTIQGYEQEVFWERNSLSEQRKSGNNKSNKL